MLLHLGVIDLPYAQVLPEPSAASQAKNKQHLIWTKHGWVSGKLGKAGKPGRKFSSATPQGQTVAEVAAILEKKYHIMEIFYELHGDDIAHDLEESLQGALENLMMGAPATGVDPFLEGTSKVEDMFKKFLSNREIETLGYPGVPTKAALNGVNHRLKIKKGNPRPSFIDTGLYQAAFKAWID